MDIGAMCEEQLHDVESTRPRRGHERCLAQLEGGIRIGARRQEARDHRRGRVHGGQPQGRRPELIGSVDLGARRNQQVRGVEIVAVGGPVKRRGAVALPQVGVRTGVEQRPDRLDLPGLDGPDQVG
jgi:hypothetical protein